MDVIRGNQTLFMRRDEVEAAWRWVDPILERLGRQPAGSAGLHGRHLGAVRVDRADRARRPHLAREQLMAEEIRPRTAHLRQAAPNWRRRWPMRSPRRWRAPSTRAAQASSRSPAARRRRCSSPSCRRCRSTGRKVTVTLVDERFVPPTSPRSNAALVADKLLQGRGGGRALRRRSTTTADSVEDAAALADDGARRPALAARRGRARHGRRTATRRRSFPTPTTSTTLLDPDQKAVVLPVHAASAGEPRLTLTLAAHRRGAASWRCTSKATEKRAVLDRALRRRQTCRSARCSTRPRDRCEIYWAA